MESHAPPRREEPPSAPPANKQSDAAHSGLLSSPATGEPRVLWLTGRPGSGKTTLARTLLREDVGDAHDQAHVTDVNTCYDLIRLPGGAGGGLADGTAGDPGAAGGTVTEGVGAPTAAAAAAATTGGTPGVWLAPSRLKTG